MPNLELFLIHLPLGIWYSISSVSMIPSKGGLKNFLTDYLNSINDIIILCFILITAVIPLHTGLIGLAWELILFQRKIFQIRYLCANFDAPSDEYYTLHNLVYRGNTEEISKLLDKKNKGILKVANFDFSEIDQYGRYPIHLAKTQEMVSFLLSKRVEIDQENSYSGQTLLHLASRRGDLKMADFLLEKGAGINKKDIRKKTPVDYAKTDKMREFLTANGGQETTLYNKFKYLFHL
ncbi:MAG: ankyrin repeat domain-containing protein [Oligoflexia bacterium]|nr:ankyrin repeat domain-containing protein [Oligoflexia bacterium]